MHAFLSGVEPAYESEVLTYLRDLLTNLPDVVEGAIGWTNEEDKSNVTTTLSKLVTKTLQDCQERLDRHVRKKHIEPLLDVIAVLPKDELAAMAQALVNLTSIKRKMSPENETVGGPVDAAVISKGDGFVWIERKHYFKPELNPQFMANYFRR